MVGLAAGVGVEPVQRRVAAEPDAARARGQPVALDVDLGGAGLLDVGRRVGRRRARRRFGRGGSPAAFAAEPSPPPHPAPDNRNTATTAADPASRRASHAASPSTGRSGNATGGRRRRQLAVRGTSHRASRWPLRPSPRCSSRVIPTASGFGLALLPVSLRSSAASGNRATRRAAPCRPKLRPRLYMDRSRCRRSDAAASGAHGPDRAELVDQPLARRGTSQLDDLVVRERGGRSVAANGDCLDRRAEEVRSPPQRLRPAGRDRLPPPVGTSTCSQAVRLM